MKKWRLTEEKARNSNSMWRTDTMTVVPRSQGFVWRKDQTQVSVGEGQAQQRCTAHLNQRALDLVHLAAVAAGRDGLLLETSAGRCIELELPVGCESTERSVPNPTGGAATEHGQMS